MNEGRFLSVLLIACVIVIAIVLFAGFEIIQGNKEFEEKRYQYFATEVAQCEATELFNREECVYLAGVK